MFGQQYLQNCLKLFCDAVSAISASQGDYVEFYLFLHMDLNRGRFLRYNYFLVMAPSEHVLHFR